uniref:RING-type domain-containing protein n=1 Tax=Attheya septentrionalis TaxID=420275 RepID=A0A7S2UJ40_9STRA|mmetsp:Transcript_24664/g.44637  ORF Transcript_24664/g.44637 Transcript_24664/m.44637 type:complete len:452 (+) Transcript_24664:209-1564(+)
MGIFDLGDIMSGARHLLQSDTVEKNNIFGNNTDANSQPDESGFWPEMNPRRGSKDMYEFIAFIVWYVIIFLCCFVPGVFAIRRRRRDIQDQQEQEGYMLRPSGGRPLHTYHMNSNGEWTRQGNTSIHCGYEPLLLMNASCTLDGRDIMILATRGDVRRLIALHDERNGKERIGKIAQATKETNMIVMESDFIRKSDSSRSLITDIETGFGPTTAVNKLHFIRNDHDTSPCIYQDATKSDSNQDLGDSCDSIDIEFERPGQVAIEQTESGESQIETCVEIVKIKDERLSAMGEEVEDLLEIAHPSGEGGYRHLHASGQNEDEVDSSEFSGLILPVTIKERKGCGDVGPKMKEGRWIAPNSCVICMSHYEIGSSVTWSPLVEGEGNLPPCRHAFHTECIVTWLAKNNESAMQCPCCRQNFISLPNQSQQIGASNRLPPTMSFDSVVISGGGNL